MIFGEHGRVLFCDVREGLAQLPDEGVQCVVTSPPYWGLRDYGMNGQLGLERTPEEYLAHMVEIFREVRRVLRKDGICWVNLGDCYAARQYGSGGGWSKSPASDGKTRNQRSLMEPVKLNHGLKTKDLCGIPWRLALALQTDGAASPGTVQAIERIVSALLIDYDSWDAVPDRTRQEIERLQREWVDAKAGSWWLRRDIIWSKPNPMPESVTDRPTSSHEYVFLLTKAARYFYDADAVREPHKEPWRSTGKAERGGLVGNVACMKHVLDKRQYNLAGRNRRSVWAISTEGFPGSHFATFPRKLVEPCLLAGTSAKGCCGKCGTPWERVVSVERSTDGRANVGTRHGVGYAQSRLDHRGKCPSGLLVQNTTIGWQPTCSCEADVEPCVVLDPFLGSGTVAEVAIRHGRRFVGIELQEDYRALIEKRLAPAITAAKQGQLFEVM